MDASIPLTSSRRPASTFVALALSLGLMVSLLACSAGRAPLSEPVPASSSQSLQATVFFCDTKDVQCRNENSDFEVNELRDLFVFVAWRGVNGTHKYQLRFILPDANQYLTLESRFTTDPAPPDPDVQVAVPSRGEPTVMSAMPVAGTLITQHSLTGTWSVEVFLDGEFVNQAKFTLQTPRT